MVEPQYDDVFDRLPDSLLLLIFNNISDIKTLIRCRAVSTRFNHLVPVSDTLLLRVDRVISTSEPDPSENPFIGFFRSILNLISSHKSHRSLTRSQNSPSQILRGFDCIKELRIELPSGDLKLEKGAAIKWKAEFGKTLKSCVILGFRGGGGGGEGELVGSGLKMRVVWTISALIAASARHYMIKDVVKEHTHIAKLVVMDREGEGVVVMGKDGLAECREENVDEVEGEGQIGNSNSGVWWKSNRTTVPAVRMRMRHEPKLELSGGVKMEGATLVVVRPTGGVVGAISEAEERSGDAELAVGAFDGVFGEAVEKLLKRRSYLLEMNSF